MRLRSYRETVAECLRDWAASDAEAVLLRAGDLTASGMERTDGGRDGARQFQGEGIGGVLGVAAGLAIAGRRTMVSLSPAAAALVALERLRLDLAGPIVAAGAPGAEPTALPLTVRVQLEGCDPTVGAFAGLRGFRIAAPSCAADAVSLLRAAVTGGGPWLYLEDRRLVSRRGDSDQEPEGPFLGAVVRRPGSDVTLIAASTMVLAALRAADHLAQRGIEAEVVDVRTIIPFDTRAVAQSVLRTHRALVIDEGGTLLGPTVASAINAAAFDDLDAPVEVVRIDPKPSLPELLASASATLAMRACWLLGQPISVPSG